jgi:hypothetical protein
MKALGSNAILGLVVDMGMIGRALRGHECFSIAYGTQL